MLNKNFNLFLATIISKMMTTERRIEILESLLKSTAQCDQDNIQKSQTPNQLNRPDFSFAKMPSSKSSIVIPEQPLSESYSNNSNVSYAEIQLQKLNSPKRSHKAEIDSIYRILAAELANVKRKHYPEMSEDEE